MSRKDILLVEDNPDDEALTLRALKKHNIANSITVVHDGVEALDYLFCRGVWENRDCNDQPQVVLLDLKLPKISGLDVLKAVRENEKTKLLPIVILTSSNEEKDILAGYELGANSYIRKPVDFEQFLEAVHELGLYWLVINQIPPNI